MTHGVAGKLFFFLMLGLASPAWAIFKCESGGKVVYADTPCEGGKVLEVRTPLIDDTVEANRHAAQDKHQLKTLERERHKREAAEHRELKKASRESAARHKKCAAHARRQKQARNEVSRTTGIANEKARRKAQQVTEAYEAECGRWYEREMSVAR
ncbi:MAG TPA: hypothetical protein VEB70_10950 [Noviherbaspirillum sp.]|nr:hypothetical protein [Noviherbaspirillum sp.]